MIYDVAIIGAGLAGLTLARQLSLEVPSAEICLIHDQTFPNPLAAHKVGESTVEIGAFYLSNVLGLDEYMHKVHILKMGLRFLQTNSDGNGYKELGLHNFPYHNAFQIDRGLLENDLHDFVKPVTDIFEQHRFVDYDRVDGVYHIKTLKADGTGDLIKARWLIDASGRKRCLARKLGFKTSFPLTHSSVWFRVDGVVDLNNMYVSDDPENVFKDAQRSHSTVHLMGKGRWVWLIPLAGHKTSVGIVFDETIIEAKDLLSQEKAFLWLKKNENRLYTELTTGHYPVLDFKYFRKYSYVSEEFLSEDKWAVVGEAKAFIDPLYSNGTDFIALENTMVCKAISAEMRGDDFSLYVKGYNEFIEGILKDFTSVHMKSYEFFNDWYYVYVKTNMDAIFYFATLCVVFMNKKLGDYDFIIQAKDILLGMSHEHERLMSYLKNKDFISGNKTAKRFIPLEDSIESIVNRDIILSQSDNDSLLELIKDNAYIHKKMIDLIISGKDFEDIFYPSLNQPPDWRYSRFFPRRVEAIV